MQALLDDGRGIRLPRDEVITVRSNVTVSADGSRSACCTPGLERLQRTRNAVIYIPLFTFEMMAVAGSPRRSAR